jgi:hypothetical protein
MPEESKQKDKDAQGKEPQATRRGKVKGFFREHPTFFLTLMYVDLTGIGILYTLIFYRQFGINIFDFAEIGDFLLAAFKAPAITFLVLLAQVLLIILFTLILRPLLAQVWSLLSVLLSEIGIYWAVVAWRKLVEGHLMDSFRQRRASEGQRNTQQSDVSDEKLYARIGYLITATVLLGAVALTVLTIVTAIVPLRLAVSQAEAVKQGEQAQVTVQYRQFGSSTKQVTERGLQYIGSTQRAVFFYDVNDKDNETENHTLVIPQAQIVSIEVPDSR